MKLRTAQMLDTFFWGGAQKMQLFLIEMLQPLGIEISVISLSEPSGSPFEKKLQEAGIRTFYFPFPKFFTPKSFSGVVSLLKKEKFDLLHAYLTYSNIIGPLAGFLSGTPVIASLRSANYDGINSTGKRVFMENMTLRYFASRVMANGFAVEEYAHYRLNNQKMVDTICNAVPLFTPIALEMRNEIRKELMGTDNRLMVISVGRLIEVKGFRYLIEGFSKLHKNGVQAMLVIAGGGSIEAKLNDQIKLLGLQSCVKLLGPRNDVPDLLGSADVYINTSLIEGTPVSVLEAMSASLPVIATRVGENPYLLANDAGILINPADPDEIAEALSVILGSAELRNKYGRSGRDRVEKFYDSKGWTRNLLDLYSKITPKAQPYLATLENSEISYPEVVV